ncbi:Endonuclease NucS [Streptomyces violarus]
MEEVLHDSSHELGVDPGLIKDGVEAHLQELLADRIETLGDGYTLIRREYPTAIGPVDILCRDADGKTVAVEIKRRGEIDGVEQLTRYLELLNRDPPPGPGPWHLRRAGDQAPGPCPRDRPLASAARSSTTTRCGASRTTSWRLV